MSDEKLILPKLKTNFSTNTSRSHLIDSSSSIILNNNYNDSSKLILELNDQVRSLRNEINHKDNEISEIRCLKDIEQVKSSQSAKIDAIFSIERSSADLARRELAGVVTQQESILNQMDGLKLDIEHRDNLINDLKRQNEHLKSELSSLHVVRLEQNNKIFELQKELGDIEMRTLKNSSCIGSVESNYKYLELKNVELESTISALKAEKDEILNEKALIKNKMTELAAQLLNKSNVETSEINGTLSSIDSILTESRVTINEFNQNKLELAELKSKHNQIEIESKNNREMIDQLVAKLNIAEKEAVEAKIESQNFKQELNKALAVKLFFEKENECIKERHSETQKLWLNNLQSSAIIEEKSQSYDKILRQKEQDIQHYKNVFEQFKTMIASLLSDDYVKVEAVEDDIKEKLNLLMVSSKDRGLVISAMENKIKILNCQLGEEISKNNDLVAKIDDYITKFNELEKEQNSVNGKYQASVSLSHHLASEKEILLSSVKKIAQLVNIETIDWNSISNLEETLNLLAEHFANKKIEEEKKIELIKNEQITAKSSFQHESKIKSLEEQLATKEINLELLRKKVVELEEVKYGRSESKKSADELILKIKHQSVKIESLNQQIAHLKAENILLKSTTLDVDGLKEKNIKQEDEVKKLKLKIDQLESLNDKHLVRIGDLREEVDVTNKNHSDTKTSSDKVISELGKELRIYKQDLEKALQRERQLLDFRHAVAKALGFNVNTLTLADYEIIARIESSLNQVNSIIIGHEYPSVTSTSTKYYFHN